MRGNYAANWGVEIAEIDLQFALGIAEEWSGIWKHMKYWRR